MKYFKNTELAKLYHISEKSVRNWVQAAQDGKLELQLYDSNGSFHIANTTKNTAIIENLVQKGKKYKNTRGAKTLVPKKEFYEMYTHEQILDIVSNIAIHHETPLQYTYVNGGAVDWDAYVHRLDSERGPNILNRTIELLDMAVDDMDQLLSTQKINVIEIGPGNGMPTRPILERLLKQGRLNRYIVVDISQDMLDILEKNIKAWFGDAVKVEAHLRDISFERFTDLVVDNASEGAVNLVLFIGGTLANFRAPDQVLQTINNSLGLGDVLVYTGYLDTPQTRRYFDYFESSSTRKVPVQDGLILDLLNIDESLYDVDQLFSEERRARSISVRPKVDLSIRLELKNGPRFIELRKGEPLLIWRHWHWTPIDLINLFDQNGFDLFQAAKSPEQNYFLHVSKIKTRSGVI